MSQSWPGRYLDGVTAQAEPVTVTPATHGLEIRRADGTLVVWRYIDVKQTQGAYTGEQIRLECGTNTDSVQALVIDDSAFLSRLHKVAPRVSQHFHDPRVRTKRPLWIAIAFAASILLSVGIYFWGIPAATNYLAERVPVAWEETLGESVQKSLVGDASLCTDKQVHAAIEGIVARLAATDPNNPYTFHVTVIRRDVMNAFAAPGGHVVVFSGLLRRTERPEELAGVLAHEMSHVMKRHGTKSAFRDLSTSMLLSLAVGDASGAMGTVLKSAKTLGGLQYSRQAEEEADLEGLKMLQTAHIDPTGMISFFQKLEEKYGSGPDVLKYVSSHPLTQDRIKKIRQAAFKRGSYIPLGTAESWKNTIAGCTGRSR